ncbi:MAG: heparinase II/III family protein [Chloroflexi bacterium]|nr:heparinase II/III family protein [Chloroflexota bacterium]
MPQAITDPLNLTAAEIQRLIVPGTAHLPELDRARQNLDTLRDAPQTRIILAQTASIVESLAQIPQTTFSHYRYFIRTGDRTNYEKPYFLKRAKLASATLRMFLGQSELKDAVQDYLWNICEETNWVLPAHERDIIDLFSAETGFALAETLTLLGDALDAQVRARVRAEIERRLFEPYLRFHQLHWWHKAGMNWNGVCNSSVAATFLMLEPEPARVARALEIALAGLRVFLDAGFEQDGSSTEGVSYWHYGLINFVALAEMLRARTKGAIDLLASERLRDIAAYPAKLLLSPSKFATFSDCDDALNFNHGIIARLLERTGEKSLLNLLTAPVASELTSNTNWRLTMMLRSILWWDGTYHAPAPITDTYLPLGGIARLVARTPQNTQVVVAIKAGHNDENHNHNDIGSFILHVDDETLLTDPGRGLYARDYFNQRRYENLFANSYSHSVPRVGGHVQKEGREFHGEIVNVEMNAPVKRVEMEFARAYAVTNLASARRQITLDPAGVVTLNDVFRFSENPVAVEEALMTWCDAQVNGATALVRGKHHELRLIIETPNDAHFALEQLEKASRDNAKPEILKRLSVVLPVQDEPQFRVRMEISKTNE